jgi:hypothetical protein
MLGLFFHIADWHLMRPERALHRLAVKFLDAGPAFRRAQNEHWPTRLRDGFTTSCRALDTADLAEHPIHSRGHARAEIVTFHKSRLPAVAGKKRAQLIVTHRAEDRRIGNLIAIHVQDR